jgi:hypothetical protein
MLKQIYHKRFAKDSLVALFQQRNRKNRFFDPWVPLLYFYYVRLQTHSTALEFNTRAGFNQLQSFFAANRPALHHSNY